MPTDFDVKSYVLETYQKNLDFLEQTQPKLYNKIVSLHLAIEKNYYQERYLLEYKDEQYFDVKEIATQKYLYGTNSNRYATTAAESINYKKVDNLFETFYPLNFSKTPIDPSKKKDLLNNSYSTVVELVNYSNKYASKTKTTMKKLYKFIFVGTGLGTHLTAIHKKLNSNVYLIIEDDLELFRLSLFVTDYKTLTSNGAKLFFSIFDEDMERKVIIRNFLHEQFIYNHYIKFFLMLNHNENALKTIQNTIATQNYLTFNYAAAMTGLLRPLEYLSKKYKILNLNGSYEHSPLHTKPLLIIGAGPSFENNIEWLKQNHQNFIIIIVSALMAKFEELGIKPDIITHVHGYADAMPHIEKVKDINFFKESIKIFGGMSYPQFTEKFEKESVYIVEGASRYKKDFGGITASNIGTITYGIFLRLKAKQFYLLGLDFAIDQTTGASHTQIHAHKQMLDLTKQQELEDASDVRHDVIEIEGNLREKVYTTVFFESMRKECNGVSYAYKTNDITTYNLSDGARINDTIALHFEDIQELKAIDKQQLFYELTETFNKNSENFLTQEEFETIELKINYYTEIIELLNQHLSKKHENLDIYHYNLLSTFQNILSDDVQDKKTSDLNTIITLYIEFISGYVFDLINTREIEDERELIKKLDNIVIPQIIYVVTFFKEKMQQAMKLLK